MSEEEIEQTKRNHRELLEAIAPIAEDAGHSQPEILLCVDLDRITLRQARKIAKALGIQQKVKGKDQPKDWLVGLIGQKLKEDSNSAAIVNEILAA